MNNKDIAKRLKDLRVKKGLTQEELADKLFLTRQAVSRWEKEKSLPDYSTLDLLSKEYKVSLDYILFGIEDSKKTNIKQIYIDYLLSLNKKNRIKTIIISILILFIFIFSLYNMIMYYGKVNVYEFEYHDDKITCTNAYLYVTNDYAFFKDCDIFLSDLNESVEEENYYIETKNSKRMIVGGTFKRTHDGKPLQDVYKGNIHHFRMNDGIIKGSTLFYKNWQITVDVTTNKDKYTFTINKNKLYTNNGIIDPSSIFYE